MLQVIISIISCEVESELYNLEPFVYGVRGTKRVTAIGIVPPTDFN